MDSGEHNARRDLGELIHRLRRNSPTLFKQESLAVKAGTTKQSVSEIENGKVIPSLPVLLNLRSALADVGAQRSDTASGENADLALATWINYWVRAKFDQELGRLESPDERGAVANLLLRLSEPLAPSWAPTAGNMSVSLGDFPRAFEPLVIVAADRRESPPKTRGDLLARSGSATDLQFLPLLRLDRLKTPVRVRSDKHVVWTNDRAFLEREFGGVHLLVLGSAAGNYAAREINEKALFRFDQPEELRGWQKRFRDVLASVTGRSRFEAFMEIAKAYDPDRSGISTDDLSSIGQEAGIPLEEMEMLARGVEDLLGARDLKSLMNLFRGPGLIDLADERVHGRAPHEDTDFACISLALNPFDPTGQKLAILAAGRSGPGTSQAVKTLARPEEFRLRPFGGVGEVTIDTSLEWPTRFENASWRWQTHPYDANVLEQRLAQRTNELRSGARVPEVYQRVTAEEVEDVAALLRRLRIPPNAS